MHMQRQGLDYIIDNKFNVNIGSSKPSIINANKLLSCKRKIAKDGKEFAIKLRSMISGAQRCQYY